MNEDLAQSKSKTARFEGLYLSTLDKLTDLDKKLNDIYKDINKKTDPNCDCLKKVKSICEAAKKTYDRYCLKPCPES